MVVGYLDNFVGGEPFSVNRCTGQSERSRKTGRCRLWMPLALLLYIFLYNIVTLMLDFFANVAQFLFAILYSSSIDSSLFFFSDIQYYLRACLFFISSLLIRHGVSSRCSLIAAGYHCTALLPSTFLAGTTDTSPKGGQILHIWLYILNIIRIKQRPVILCSAI